MFCLKNFSKSQKEQLRREAEDQRITWDILFLSLLKVLSKIAAEERPLGKILSLNGGNFNIEQRVYSLGKIFFSSKPFQDSLTKRVQELLPETERVVLSAELTNYPWQDIKIVAESSRPFGIERGERITPFPLVEGMSSSYFADLNLDDKIYQILFVLNTGMLIRIVTGEFLDQITDEYWQTEEGDNFRFHALLRSSSEYIANYLSQYFYIDRCHFETFT